MTDPPPRPQSPAGMLRTGRNRASLRACAVRPISLVSFSLSSCRPPRYRVPCSLPMDISSHITVNLSTPPQIYNNFLFTPRPAAHPTARARARVLYHKLYTRLLYISYTRKASNSSRARIKRKPQPPRPGARPGAMPPAHNTRPAHLTRGEYRGVAGYDGERKPTRAAHRRKPAPADRIRLRLTRTPPPAYSPAHG
jgi:hypothetical protein